MASATSSSAATAAPGAVPETVAARRRAWRQLGLIGLCLLALAGLPHLAALLGSPAGTAISQCCPAPAGPVTSREQLIYALRFFGFESLRVLILLVLVVFVVGVGRSFVTPERTRRRLLRHGERLGTVLAALLGVVTPFCSCSAISLFIGFVSAGVPLGVTFAFLVAAPMVNEVALVMLWAMVGWKMALLYAAMGLVVAIASGWVIGALNLRRQVEDWVLDFPSATHDSGGRLPWPHRVSMGMDNVRRILGKVWVYVLCGIGAGAIIHGYVPEDFMGRILGKQAWWAVPVAVLLGVPMYSNAAGVIPIVEALLAKGAALGTALAFMMAVTALSLPELIILRKVLKPRLLAGFFGIVALGILLVGYLFNLLL